MNIYDLGLIYKIDLQDDGEVVLDMTLTAPIVLLLIYYGGCTSESRLCGRSYFIGRELGFEPEWDKDMMSEEAKLELGFL